MVTDVPISESPPPPLTSLPQGQVPRISAKLMAALAAGKGAAVASRLLRRGGGTSLTGMVARRVDRRILGTLIHGNAVPVVAVTGSNGKTTTARFAAALVRGEGLTVMHNSAGSNLSQGVTSLAVTAANFRGKIPRGVMIAEVDEGALVTVAQELAPRVLVVTNVFRDQLDRFGELYGVARAIESVAEGLPQESTLVVNADDPLVADMNAGNDRRRITFGLNLAQSTDHLTRAADTIRCPRCRSDLTYKRLYLSHLGDYACEKCGFTRPPLDVAVTSYEPVGLDRTRVTVATPQGDVHLEVPQVGVHIAYDIAGAVAACIGLGLDIPHAAQSLKGVRTAFGRLEQIDADGRHIVLAFAKNPTSFNVTLKTLAAVGEPRHLLAAISNTLVDGEDFGWLWDVDFESAMSSVEHVTVSGLRGDEFANRLKYAGLDTTKMVSAADRSRALDVALENVPHGGTLVIVAGYTPTIELREEMRRRGWVNRFWQQ